MRVLQYISKLNTFSLYHKLWFYNPYIVAYQCCRPKIFQTMNYVALNNKIIKVWNTLLHAKIKRIRKFKFGTKTQIFK